MSYVCPVCGKPTKYDPRLGGLCVECFRKRQMPQSREIKAREKLYICRDCGAVKIGDEWVEPKPKSLKIRLMRIAKRALRGYEIRIRHEVLESLCELLGGSEEYDLRIPVTLVRDGIELGEVMLVVPVKPTVCPTCFVAKSGGGWTFVAHIRAITSDGRKKLALVEKLVYQTLGHDVDLQKFESGFSIRHRDTRAGERLINRLRVELGALVHSYVQRKKIRRGKEQIVIKKYIVEL